MKDYVCPCCGLIVTNLVEKEVNRILKSEMAARGSKGGAAKTKAQTESHRRAIAAALASYTPEKRKLAAQKRLATIAARKAEGK